MTRATHPIPACRAGQVAPAHAAKAAPPRPAASPDQPRRSRARRAMSMLEIVAAVAILALITATVTTGLNYLVSQNGRERRQLACMEMANRLVLQFLDDKNAMPSVSLPLDYGNERFMYSMKDQRVELKDNRRVSERQTTRQGGVARDRVRQLTIRVWLFKDSQGREYPPDSAPSATLSRIYDPLPLQRNPDSLQNMLEGQGIRDIIEVLQNGGNTP